ncbi:hypothetical protein CO613_08015 [Lysobacteraceae bacterium NML07-0707]|nr:hypothetical protein CO613_08015 [Xanthomonadaceae bacterium NML07-0707]
MNKTHAIFAATLVSALAITGCKKKEEPAVVAPPASTPALATPPATQASINIVALELGKGLADDKRVAEASTQFGAQDTIHASVNTQGDGAGKKLGARWTYQDGTLVHEEVVDMVGNDSIYAFKISNTNPWPTGNYKVEISLDGQPLQSRDFSVK